MALKRAERTQRKARIALVGVAGSGKTLTALIWARALAGEGRFAVVDTERSSASIYAGKCPPGEKVPLDFDVDELPSFEPEMYIRSLDAIARANYPVVVIDSASHAWIGEGGILEQADKGGSTRQAWGKLTPKQRNFLNCILDYPGHVIVTLRAKPKVVEEENERGKKVQRRIGMEAQQKEGMEYEFDIFGLMDTDNELKIEKTRVLDVREFAVGATHSKPGRALAEKLLVWCEDGAARKEVIPAVTKSEPKPVATMEERIAKNLAALDAIKTKADFDKFTVAMNNPSTSTELKLALSPAWLKKGAEFVTESVA